jgi:hypothetical protein
MPVRVPQQSGEVAVSGNGWQDGFGSGTNFTRALMNEFDCLCGGVGRARLNVRLFKNFMRVTAMGGAWRNTKRLVRPELWPKVSPEISSALNAISRPTKWVGSATPVYRVWKKRKSMIFDYDSVMRQVPSGPGVGSRSSDNRFSGLLPDGKTPGVSGSYWATMSGLMSESFFYNCYHGVEKADYPRRLMPPMREITVIYEYPLPFYAHKDVPEKLPFSAGLNYDAFIFVAKTVI